MQFKEQIQGKEILLDAEMLGAEHFKVLQSGFRDFMK